MPILVNKTRKSPKLYMVGLLWWESFIYGFRLPQMKWVCFDVIMPNIFVCSSLTHWGREIMIAISQTFSNSSSWIKMYEFWLRFQWSLFLMVPKNQYSGNGSDNGLAPTRRQAIIWPNNGQFIDVYIRQSAIPWASRRWRVIPPQANISHSYGNPACSCEFCMPAYWSHVDFVCTRPLSLHVSLKYYNSSHWNCRPYILMGLCTNPPICCFIIKYD